MGYCQRMIFPGVARQLLCITEAKVIFPVHVTEMEFYASLLHGMITYLNLVEDPGVRCDGPG